MQVYFTKRCYCTNKTKQKNWKWNFIDRVSFAFHPRRWILWKYPTGRKSLFRYLISSFERKDCLLKTWVSQPATCFSRSSVFLVFILWRRADPDRSVSLSSRDKDVRGATLRCPDSQCCWAFCLLLYIHEYVFADDIVFYSVILRNTY